jgi:pyruvate dehydrogenase E2 component (dihydrolipoamide acetyltransferase)
MAPHAGGRVFASPNARRLAREAGLRVEDLQGTGPNGRIIGRDVRAAVAHRPTMAAPEPVLVRQVRVRGRVCARRALKLCERLNPDEPVPITLDDLVVRAAARAHRLVLETGAPVDVAIAMPVGRGLVRPVLEAADAKPISALAIALGELTERAKGDGLGHDGTGGAAFTVLSLSRYGTEEIDVAIEPSRAPVLVIGAVREEPVAAKGRVKSAPVIRATLTIDPRALDVTVAAAWMRTFAGLLENPVRVLL